MILRCPRSIKTTNAVTATAKTKIMTTNAELNSPVLASSSVPPTAVGNPETMLMNMIITIITGMIDG